MDQILNMPLLTDFRNLSKKKKTFFIPYLFYPLLTILVVAFRKSRSQRTCYTYILTKFKLHRLRSLEVSW